MERRAGRRRMLPKAARGRLTAAGRRRVLAVGRCLRCGAREALQADHVQPVSRGGTNDESNRQCLCAACNRWKGARWIDYRTNLYENLLEKD